VKKFESKVTWRWYYCWLVSVVCS